MPFSIERFGRVALFVVYVWFGLLKALSLSPAGPLVGDLYGALVARPAWFPVFYMAFALFEILVGVSFLAVGARRWVVALFATHMAMTFAPLVALPGVAWAGPFVPTLVGQYIIKNLALVALVLFLRERSLKPSSRRF